MHDFDTPEQPALVLRTAGGRVNISAGDGDRTTVELTPLNPAGEEAVARAAVEQRGSTIVVHLPRHRGGLLRPGAAIDVSVTCPTGTSLDVQADSADVHATGTYARVVVVTGSGHIEVEDVTGPAKLKSGSGDVSVDRSARSASLTAGSGDISVGELAGEVTTRTGSGDIEVGRLDGTLLTKTGSGSLTVRRASSGTVRATGASGNITIGVKDGTAAWLDVSTVSGRVRQELGESEAPPEDHLRVQIMAQTVSGNVRVHRS